MVCSHSGRTQDLSAEAAKPFTTGFVLLTVNVNVSRGLRMIEPHGSLQQEDFHHLTSIVDAKLERNVALHSIMIRTKDFSGCNSFAKFVDPIRFVCDHHKHIARITLVTKSPVGHLFSVLVRHFIQAEIHHFTYKDCDMAINWLTDKG